MDKEQALHSFWSSFALKAYDQNTVPDKAELAYFTYETATGELGDRIPLVAHLWDRTREWTFLDKKKDEVSKFISEMLPIKIDEGYLYITKGVPFARRIGDENDSNIKGIAFNIVVEFFTNN